jgi:hypothetical protein
VTINLVSAGDIRSANWTCLMMYLLLFFIRTCSLMLRGNPIDGDARVCRDGIFPRLK